MATDAGQQDPSDHTCKPAQEQEVESGESGGVIHIEKQYKSHKMVMMITITVTVTTRMILEFRGIFVSCLFLILFSKSHCLPKMGSVCPH